MRSINIKTSILLALITVVCFVGYFLLSIPYYSGDVKNHIVWGRSILEEGSRGFYGRIFHDYSFPNYPPVSMLSFAGSILLHDSLKSLISNLDKIQLFPSVLVKWINDENVGVSFLKIPAILPFVLTGLVIYAFGRDFGKSKKESIFYMLAFLFNPSFIYLAVIWGQNDFAQVLFILAAILFLFRENFFMSAISGSLAILSKQTVLMVWGLFILTLLRFQGFKKAGGAILIALVSIWLFYLPFNEGSLIWPFTFYNETLRTTGLLVSDNAINYWGALSRFRQSSSQEIILFLKLENWGFLFFIALFLPAIYRYFTSKFSKELLIYFLFMASTIYFFSLTRMHERYLIFGVVFAHLLMMTNKKYWYNLAFFTVLLFLNLYKGLLLPDFPILVSLSKSITFLTILALAYLLVLAYNYYYFLFKTKYEKS